VDRHHRRAALRQARLGGRRVDQARLGLDVAEHRGGARVQYRERRGDEGVRRNHDLVARADAGRDQRQRQCGRAGPDADTLVRRAGLRELALEGLDLGAEDECVGRDDPVEGRPEGFAQRLVRPM
jgi:hypothetical protein